MSSDDYDDFDFNPDVTVVYDFPDATTEITIEIHPHENRAIDIQHMTMINGLRESITTFCQLHHYYREQPELLPGAHQVVGAVQYYVELANAHALIDALQDDRPQIDFTRRVLLLNKLVESLSIVVRRNVTASQALAWAQTALQAAEEFDLEGSADFLDGLHRDIPYDYSRYLPTDPDEQQAVEGREVLAKVNNAGQDYPFFIFVDDAQTNEEYLEADELDDKSKLVVLKGEWPLTWDDVHPRRRIFMHTV